MSALRILSHLNEETTVSELWEKVRSARSRSAQTAPLSFDWFVLALSFLFAISAIDLERGMVQRDERAMILTIESSIARSKLFTSARA